jgi:hypothetical protein
MELCLEKLTKDIFKVSSISMEMFKANLTKATSVSRKNVISSLKKQIKKFLKEI